MKKIVLTLLSTTTIFLFGCGSPVIENNNLTQKENTQEEYSQYQSKVAVDKIQLYLFRGTIQCWTCIKLGELTEKTLDESFVEEVKSGKITYEDINVELPENHALAQKFEVRYISLYINTLIGENESYEEQTNLMRYLNNEEQFKKMLKEKLNGLLGK